MYLLLLATAVFVAGCGRIGFDASVHDGNDAASVCDEPASHDLFHGGNGTSSEPFTICLATELIAVGRNPSFWGSSFSLESNIDLSEYDGSSADLTYTPVGYFLPSDTVGAQPFSGEFRGNDHIISNLQFDRGSSSEASGLFAYTNEAVLTDLHLGNISLIVGDSGGGLVGRNENTPISGCSVTGSITGKTNVGGIAGQNLAIGSMASSTISECSTNINIMGADSVAGLVGYNLADDGGRADIIESSSKGLILSTAANTFGGLVGLSRAYNTSSTQYISSHSEVGLELSGTGSFSGGLIGSHRGEGMSTVSVIDCYATGSITTPADFNSGFVGGLIGIMGVVDNTQGNIVRSYSTGSITITSNVDRSFVGGLVGYHTVESGSTGNISDAFSWSSIAFEGPGGSRSAGFIGHRRVVSDTSNSSIVNSYATGRLTGSSLNASVGGFVGQEEVFSSGTMSYQDSFWNTDEMSVGIGESLDSSLVGVSGQSDVAMTQQATFTNWDFGDVWEINEATQYPTLRDRP